MEPHLPEVTVEPSLDAHHENDDNHSDGDFDNDSDGDGDFYSNGRIDFRKMFPNTDDNPIEFVYEYDRTGYVYSVYTRKKKDFVAIPVPANDDGTHSILSEGSPDNFVAKPVAAASCILSERSSDNEENADNNPTQVPNPLVTHHNDDLIIDN